MGPYKPSPFQPLRKQTQAITVPPKHLNKITAAATEDEQMSRERILFKNRLYKSAQSSETAPQVRDACSDPNVRPRWQRNHRARLSIAARTQSGSVVPSIRTRA